MTSETSTSRPKPNVADAAARVAVLPFRGSRITFPLMLGSSIAMFLADHNGFLDIPWFIAWLPVMTFFIPFFIVCFILLASVVAMLGGLIAVSIAWLVVKAIIMVREFFFRIKVRRAMRTLQKANQKADKK